MSKGPLDLVAEVELMNADPLEDTVMCVDMLLVARLQDVETGVTSLYVTKSEGTDSILVAGLVASLVEVTTNDEWSVYPRPDDDIDEGP